MPTLADLKSKWFIAIDGTSPDGVPRTRHSTASALAVCTDGNTVTPLIDGKNYMGAWHDAIMALHGVADAEVYHTGWRLEGVKTLGESIPASDALETINNADNVGVTFRVLLSYHLPFVINDLTSTWLLSRGVPTLLDNRYPAPGSNHFKFAVMKHPGSTVALLGSVDISKSRWDDSQHFADNPERNPAFGGKPTHDTGVLLKGPAVADIETTFIERWNDPGYNIFPNITSPVSSPAATGTHSVQVLRTFGVATDLAYTWSPRGEFSVWASYLNAIKKAEIYIYIEDQYFLPFDWPPAFTKGGMAAETDIIFQLGEAIKRGVRIAVLSPSNAEDIGKGKSKYQRDVGINYLRRLKAEGAPGELVVASLKSGTGDIYVHSKLMIVDDELILIGSANIGQRSMTCDGELQIAVVDENNVLAKQFRSALWQEHMAASIDLDDPVSAYDLFVSSTAALDGNLKPYPVDAAAIYPGTSESTAPEKGHGGWMREVFDPYAGPAGIR